MGPWGQESRELYFFFFLLGWVNLSSATRWARYSDFRHSLSSNPDLNHLPGGSWILLDEQSAPRMHLHVHPFSSLPFTMYCPRNRRRLRICFIPACIQKAFLDLQAQQAYACGYSWQEIVAAWICPFRGDKYAPRLSTTFMDRRFWLEKWLSFLIPIRLQLCLLQKHQTWSR